MKNGEWADKSPYEKGKIEKEVNKFNDLVKIKINTSSYSPYGIYQYDKFFDMYDRLNNNIEWIYNFQTERQDIINNQIKYLKNIDTKCLDYTSEKVHLKLQFKHTDDLIKHFDLKIDLKKHD